jgi:trk system potassium uptake protein TrkA
VVAKGVGAARSIVRVHHSTYFEERGLAYTQHLGIDKLICPEYSTALSIARTLRNPGALAIEDFARGKIEMQEVLVSRGASAIGVALADLGLPRGTRLAAIHREDRVFLPEGSSVVQAEDKVVIVGNADVFQQARRLFSHAKGGKKRVALMGGPAMAVWLCRALKRRDFAIRLFEIKHARAEELAEKLEWVTVIEADPSDRATFDEENLAQADAWSRCSTMMSTTFSGARGPRAWGWPTSWRWCNGPTTCTCCRGWGLIAHSARAWLR